MIKIQELDELLINAGIDTAKRNQVIADAEKLEEMKKEENKSNKLKTKYKFTVCIRGDEEIAQKVQEAWIIKTILDQDDNEIVPRIQKAVGIHNSIQKKLKNYIHNLGDFFEFIKRKITKEDEVNLQIMTKTPCRVVTLKNYNIAEL